MIEINAKEKGKGDFAKEISTPSSAISPVFAENGELLLEVPVGKKPKKPVLVQQKVAELKREIEPYISVRVDELKKPKPTPEWKDKREWKQKLEPDLEPEQKPE